jgi:flagellar biogenesis protein FliO
MPSIARVLGLLFVVAHATALSAQQALPNHAPPGQSRTPPPGYLLPVGPSDGFGPGLVRGETSRSLQAATSPDGQHNQRALVRRAPEVIRASYDAPVPSGHHPPGSSEAVQRSGETEPSVPLSPRSGQSPLPLPNPGHSGRTQPGRGGLPSVVTVASSLAVVLGIFFLVAWGIRRAAPGTSAVLPTEVFEVLGRAPMAGRQQLHLLRCGKKLVLVCVTPAGAETLTEITEPVEVDRLAGLCRQAHPNSTTAAFRQVFGQFVSLRSGAGFFGDSDREGLRQAATRLPATSDRSENRDV